MRTISDEAIVLRQLEYSETSQIAVLLTSERGKVRAIAKGVRRATKNQFSPGLDVLDVGQAGFSIRSERQEGLSRMFDFKQTLPLTGIRNSLASLYAALYLVDVIAVLTEDWDPHPRTFTSLKAAMCELARGADALSATTRVQAVFLGEIGSLPRFDQCVQCGARDGLEFFSSLAGGVICQACRPRQRECRPLSRPTRGALQSYDWPRASLGCFRLFDYHMSHLMGRQSRVTRSLLGALPDVTPLSDESADPDTSNMPPD